MSRGGKKRKVHPVKPLTKRWRRTVRCDGCDYVGMAPHARDSPPLALPCPKGCGSFTATYAHA